MCETRKFGWHRVVLGDLGACYADNYWLEPGLSG